MPLPILTFTTPPEPYALSETPTCDRTDKPGVVAFRNLVLSTVGGGDLGMDRPCTQGSPSDHWSRRAWDWKLDASNPDDLARANTLITWLTDKDNELIRRAGITFIVWNHQVWSTKMGMQWQPYTGPNPHTDHMHISFGWPGASAQTSLYGALGVTPGGGSGPGVPVAVGPSGPGGGPSAEDVVSIVAGAAAGWFGMRWFRKMVQKRRVG